MKNDLKIRLEIHNLLNFLQQEKLIFFLEEKDQNTIVNKILDILHEKKKGE